MRRSLTKYRSTDALAISLSGICVIHCMILPLIVSLSPLLGLASQEWVHQALVIVAAPVSLSVLIKAIPGLNRYLLAGGIGVGLACLFAGAFIHAVHAYEELLTTMGALILATTHGIRWWQHKRLQSPPEINVRS